MNILSIHARPGGKRTMPAPLGRGGNRVSDMAPPTSLQPGPQPSTVGEYAVMLCCRHSFAVYTEKEGPCWCCRCRCCDDKANVFDCLEEEGSKKGHAPHVNTTAR